MCMRNISRRGRKGKNTKNDNSSLKSVDPTHLHKTALTHSKGMIIIVFMRCTMMHFTLMINIPQKQLNFFGVTNLCIFLTFIIFRHKNNILWWNGLLWIIFAKMSHIVTYCVVTILILLLLFCSLYGKWYKVWISCSLFCNLNQKIIS